MKHISGGKFLKPMLMYDQGLVKIQKMGKQIFCFNHVYGSLIVLEQPVLSLMCCARGLTLRIL